MPKGYPEGQVNPIATSMVQIRIGNRNFDARYEPTCKTCTHPARMEIEEGLIKGDGYRTIARQFSGVKWVGRDGQSQVLPEIGYGSIRNHYDRGHMPLSAAVMRQIAEDRAREVGEDYEEMANRYVDHVTVARAIVHKGHERLVMGELEPDLRETLAAAKLLKDIDAEATNNLDVEMWNQAMVIYFETARELMPPEMWVQFTQRLRENEVLQALAIRQEQTQAIEG